MSVVWASPIPTFLSCALLYCEFLKTTLMLQTYLKSSWQKNDSSRFFLRWAYYVKLRELQSFQFTKYCTPPYSHHSFLPQQRFLQKVSRETKKLFPSILLMGQRNRGSRCRPCKRKGVVSSVHILRVPSFLTLVSIPEFL